MHVSSKPLGELERREKAELAQKVAQMHAARLNYSAPDLAYMQRANSSEPPAVAPTVFLATRATAYALPENVAPEPEDSEWEYDRCWNMRTTINLVVILLGMTIVLRYLNKHRSFLNFRNPKRRLVITYQPPRNVRFLGSEELNARMGKDAPPDYCAVHGKKPPPISEQPLTHEPPPALYSRIIVTSNTGAPPITIWDKYSDQKVQEIMDLVKNSQEQTRKVPSTIYIDMPMESYRCDLKRNDNVFIGLSSKDGPFGVDFGVTINNSGEINVVDPQDWVDSDQETKKFDDDVKIIDPNDN